MAKVVVTQIRSGNKTAVTSRRYRDAGTGKFITVHTVDANSPTFADDMSYVFKKNVARARRVKK